MYYLNNISTIGTIAVSPSWVDESFNVSMLPDRSFVLLTWNFAGRNVSNSDDHGGGEIRNIGEHRFGRISTLARSSFTVSAHLNNFLQNSTQQAFQALPVDKFQLSAGAFRV
jgi:hypothetical protein